MDRSLPGERVARVLDRLIAGGKKLEVIVVDNGPEFTSKALEGWATRNKVQLRFIDAGKPMQNGYIESFNGRFRDKCLNQHRFESVAEVREISEKWREDYNQERPHSSLGQQTAAEFARRCGLMEETKKRLGLS